MYLVFLLFTIFVFPKMVVPPFHTPKRSFVVGKPIVRVVGETHHLRKHPCLSQANIFGYKVALIQLSGDTLEPGTPTLISSRFMTQDSVILLVILFQETSETQAIDPLFLPQQLRGIQVEKNIWTKNRSRNFLVYLLCLLRLYDPVL